MNNKRDKKWIGAAIGLVSTGINLVSNLISKNKQRKLEEEQRLKEAEEQRKNEARQNAENLSAQLNDTSISDAFKNRLEFKKGGKIKNKIEAEDGEIIKSDKPMFIKNGGIAIPLGNGYNLLRGNTHKQGGIDIDMKGDGRVWSNVPFLNGESPAKKVLNGENPNKVFAQQELFKQINNLKDDGNKKELGMGNDNNKKKILSGFKIKNTRNNLMGLDNSLTGKLINYAENADSIGYKNGRWYSPTVTHPKSKFDKNNRGMGVDINTNPYVSKYLKTDNKGRSYLTERDERFIRHKSIKDAMESADKRIEYARKRTGSDKKVSEKKKAALSSIIYNLGSGKVANYLFEDLDLMNSLFNGSDNDFNRHLNGYLSYKNRNDRIKRTSEILNLDTNFVDKRKFIEKRNKERKTKYNNDVKNGKVNSKTTSFNEFKNGGQIYSINGNIKQGLGYSPSTGERKKAKDGLAIGNAALNLVGGLASYFHNRKALKDMENNGIGDAPKSPVSIQAAKLNTNYNINPQLNNIAESEAAMFKDINSNVSDSNTALALKQRTRLNSLLQRNSLYGEKANQELSLINQDALNRQQISSINNQQYNQYLKDLYNHRQKENEFKLNLLDKKSENLNSLVQNSIQSLSSVGDHFIEKESNKKKLAIFKEMYPDAYNKLEKAGLLKCGGKIKKK